MPPPVAKDAGVIVTTAEVQTYAHEVDASMDKFKEALFPHKDAIIANVPLAEFVRFKLWFESWKTLFAEVKAGGWFATNRYDEIRGYNIELLRWRDRFVARGIPVGGVELLQPSNAYAADVPNPGDLAIGAGAAVVGVGVVLGALYLLTRGR